MGLVAISVDELEDSRTLASKEGIWFPLLSDPDLKVGIAYGVAMEGRDIHVPAVFIVDRDQNIAWQRIGETQFDRQDADDILAAAAAL